jgi:hypothetical protein
VQLARRPLTLADSLPTGSPPSTYAAYAAVTGEPGGWQRVIGTTVLRAGIISAGLYAAGQRRRVFRSALYGSAAIEVFVLGYAFMVAKRNGAR